MNIESLLNHCLAKDVVTESFPFDETTLVFKVAGKVFAICGIDPFESVNLKCDPIKAIELRELHAEIKPGYHMNKKHWNTISIKGDLSDQFIFELVDESYNLVVENLSKKVKEKILGK